MLEFEKKIESVQNRINALQAKPILSIKERQDIQKLENKKERYIQETYARLTAWQKVLVARHTGRPQAKDYIARLITRWTPLSGDRIFGEDKAVVSGIGFLHNTPVMVIGHDKGHDTTSRIERNFGMAYPEGYRKARRLLYMAEQFQLPVIFLVDTKGAYMGAAAEGSVDSPKPLLSALKPVFRSIYPFYPLLLVKVDREVPLPLQALIILPCWNIQHIL